jgi:hypothetical protein
MSKISQYPIVQAAEDDLVIVTAPNASPSNATKNVTVGSIAQFAAQVQLGYDVYTALVTQKTTDDPTAIELNNTTGATMSWKRIGVGTYTVEASAAIFSEDKTIACLMGGSQDNSSVTWQWFDDDTIEIYTFDSTQVAADAVLERYSFEIRIYN